MTPISQVRHNEGHVTMCKAIRQGTRLDRLDLEVQCDE